VSTDRDRSIEQLLRRSNHATDQPGPHCLDAETLAAFSDGALMAAERLAVEAHVADCQRCQAITAAMIRAMAPETAAAEVVRWWTNRRVLNWLVPAAAGATAVALWVAVPGQRTALPEQLQVTNQSGAEPASAATGALADKPADAAAAPSSPTAAARERDGGPAATNPNQSVRGPTASPDAAPPAEPSGFARRDEDLAAVREERAAAAESQRLTAQAPTPAQPALAATARAASAAMAAAVEVPSPDPRHRWRVGQGAVVEHSEDGGATWTPQATGTAGSVTSGHSPSPLVCWLVGPDGLVLRSDDGGRRWQRTAMPDMSDVVAVSARDALNATVTLADSRRLSTTDGGVSWTPVRE
jgi:hypothetical protein